MYRKRKKANNLSSFSKVLFLKKRALIYFVEQLVKKKKKKLSYESLGGGCVNIPFKQSLFLAVRIYFHLLWGGNVGFTGKLEATFLYRSALRIQIFVYF